MGPVYFAIKFYDNISSSCFIYYFKVKTTAKQIVFSQNYANFSAVALFQKKGKNGGFSLHNPACGIANYYNSSGVAVAKASFYPLFAAAPTSRARHTARLIYSNSNSSSGSRQGGRRNTHTHLTRERVYSIEKSQRRKCCCCCCDADGGSEPLTRHSDGPT